MNNPFELLDARLSNIENLLLDIKQSPKNSLPEPDQWFDLNQLVEFDPEKRTKATFYSYVSRKTIPFHKKAGGKKLLFLKSEIIIWLKQGRIKTLDESSLEADAFLRKRGMK